MNHFAFSIDAADVSRWRTTLEEEGVEVDCVMTWAGGAKSLYFRDPDDHLVELITAGYWRL